MAVGTVAVGVVAGRDCRAPQCCMGERALAYFCHDFYYCTLTQFSRLHNNKSSHSIFAYFVYFFWHHWGPCCHMIISHCTGMYMSGSPIASHRNTSLTPQHIATGSSSLSSRRSAYYHLLLPSLVVCAICCYLLPATFFCSACHLLLPAIPSTFFCSAYKVVRTLHV